MLAIIGLIYFIGMMVALAFAISDLDDNAVDNPRQTMGDVALMAGGYMLGQMILWPWNAAVYVRNWLRDRVAEED